MSGGNGKVRVGGPWWRTAVTYQVYPRSLRDSTGSGIGDLNGITESLEYIRSLGVDAIWLSPFYPSPQVDAGYDVSDYTDVDPLFGTLEDFDRLVTTADKMGLRVIIDLVPNHSSDQHPLFQAALAAPAGSPERSLYHFVSEDEPPNNWRSVFGGPSWTRVDQNDLTESQWYYHLFAPEQPDFNWENPAVLEFFKGVLRFWLDRGVAGFRIDVSDALIKDTEWPDTPDHSPVIPKDESSPVHRIYRHLRAVLDEYPGDRMAVLETGAPDSTVALFLRPDEMHQAFNLRFLKTPWNARALAKSIIDSLAAAKQVGTTVTWVSENHDNTRSVSRYGTDEAAVGEYVPEVTGSGRTKPDAGQRLRGERRARAMALLLLSLPGSAYIYQGQELGLPQVDDLPDEVLTDPVFFRSKGTQRGRDGCRIPLPWRGEEPPYGFSPEPAATWLPQPDDWASLTVETQNSEAASMLNWYRLLLNLREKEPALGSGILAWISNPEDPSQKTEGNVLHFSLTSPHGRTLEVLVNFGTKNFPIPAGKVLAASFPLPEGDGKSVGVPEDGAILVATENG